MDIVYTITLGGASGILLAVMGNALKIWRQSELNGKMLEEVSSRTKETLSKQDNALAEIKSDVADIKEHGSGPARHASEILDRMDRWRNDQELLNRSYGERIAVMESRYTDLNSLMQRNHAEVIATIEKLRANISVVLGQKMTL